MERILVDQAAEATVLLCAHMGCTFRATDQVHLHDGAVPYVVDVCYEHISVLAATDMCRSPGCSERAKSFGMCGSHAGSVKPISYRRVREEAKRTVAAWGNVRGEPRRDDVKFEETCDEVLYLLGDRGPMRLSQLALEAKVKMKEAEEALRHLAGVGKVFHTGRQRTKDGLWELVVAQSSAATSTFEKVGGGA